MREQILEAYISHHRTYSISCLRCNRTQRFRTADIPPSRPNPFTHKCPCGVYWNVRLVGMRGGHRKLVTLAGSLVRATDPRKIRVFCTILNISRKGLWLSTEPIKNLTKGEVIQVSLVLDNKKRTRLELPGKIGRIGQAKNHWYLAVEFLPLPTRYLEIIDTYVGS